MGTTPLTTEQEEYLAYIVSSAEQLKHVVSDILDSKQLGTELVIERQPVSVRECLNEALQQSGIHAITGAKRMAGVYAHVEDDVPEYIMSDRGRVVQVLVNLIHNSIRFTDRNNRHVYISIENLSSSPPHTLIPPLDSEETTPLILPTTHTSPTTPRSPSTSPFASPQLLSIKNFAVSPLLIPTTPPTTHDHPTPISSSSFTRVVRFPQQICITLRDNGAGMDEEAISRVFHTDNSLSKTKHVIELLGGSIKIESEGKNKGATVTIILKSESRSSSQSTSPAHPTPKYSSDPPPLNLSTSSHAISPLPTPSPTTQQVFSSTTQTTTTTTKQARERLETEELGVVMELSGVRALLVEDNLMNQKVLRRLFNKIGIVPDIASHGAEAVEMICNKHYDIVFMDLHMPVCDGFEATRQIQELPDTMHKPRIYALTASVSLADKERCMKLGMKGHLPKPVSVQSLIDALAEAIPRT